MMLPDSLLNLEVRNIMISPIPTVKRNTKVYDAAKIIVEEKLPALIVIDEKNNLIGYIDAIDVLKKFLNNSGEDYINDILKIPLPVVKANEKIINVMRIFTLRKVPIVAVIYKRKFAGFVSTREMLRILPEIIESIIVKQKFEEKPVFKVKASLMGYCDRCGAWSDKLIEVDGNYYCPDCVVDLFGEEVA